ncbi:MAG: sugar phosphate isomerase/epimerase [Planctomycetota bacterium]|jgi:sugar phosphate isomerase/epimerase|nr:sugar phosphate isomerase/epimerase [Planctomycetota bacterium]
MTLAPWSLGVFTSIDAGLGVQLEVARELGVPTIQLHTPHAEGRTPEAAEKFVRKLKDYGIELTCVFGGFEGESYADIPTVERTIGLVPRETRDARLVEMKEISDFTRLLGCSVIGLHVGVVPHDRGSKDYAEVIDITRQLCDHAARNGQAVHLETGQETAEALLKYIEDSERKNLFINFDPANMILYGTGEPIPALKMVGKYVRSVHCKDGTWSDQPGVTWGCEVPLGKGDVDMRAYLSTLKEIGYTGPLTIEREIPQEPERQKAEILHATGLLEQLKKEILG